MATIKIIQGQTTYIDPQVQYSDSGWVINGKYATHYPCFAGTMNYSPALPLIDGQSYDFKYKVDNYVSNTVQLRLGTSNGAINTSSGEFTDTFVYHVGDTLRFYSDGELRVTVLSIANHSEIATDNSKTFAFNEATNRWVQNYGVVPELMISFSDRFFSFKNGQIWEEDKNPIAGNFFGVKYPARVTFVVNIDYNKDKLFYNLRLDAKGKWHSPQLVIPPSNQFPNGMLSKLKKNNFGLIDGKLWANLLNDLNDPNFAGNNNEAEVLFLARKLQGGWLVITLECNDDAACEISSVETYYTETMRAL